MTEDSLNRVETEQLIKVQSLNMVLTVRVVLSLANLTIYTNLRAVKLALVVRIIGMSPSNSARSIEAQPIGETNVCHCSSVQLVKLAGDIIIKVGTERVTCPQESTGIGIVRTRTSVVILRIAVGIGTDDRIAVGIQHTYIDRIDRSNTSRIVAQVSRAKLILIIVRIADSLAVHIANVNTYVEPLGEVIVGFHTGIEALVA